MVGVLPPRAAWPENRELFLPLRPSLLGNDVRTRRDNMIFQALARLAVGVTREQAEARMRTIATRLEQISDYPLDLNQGTLYPALVRLEQKGWIKGSWRKTENNREAKFYTLTKAGERALTEKVESWRRLAGLVDKLLLEL